MNDETLLPDDDRAVSELVGFVLVFGIIISSVGVLYVTGFSAMGDFQEHEQTTNAERAMDALAENFNDIVASDGVRYRSGELNLREGSISSSTNETTVAVDTPSGWMNATGSFSYESGDTTIVYEGGAVTRSTESGGWTVRNPPIRCTDDVAIISIVELNVEESTVTAHGSRSITATQVETDVTSFSGNGVMVVDSPRLGAWERTLLDTGWKDEGTPGDGKFVCETDDVVIRKTTIDIDYN